MPDLQFSTDIYRPPEAVFGVLADIAHYSAWLPPSKTYVGTVDISDMPIKQGTTYVDKNTNGDMQGDIRAYQPPSLIVFHQHSKMPDIDITIHYALTPIPQGTRLDRTTSLVFSGIFKLIQPLAVPRIREENALLKMIMIDL